MGTGAVAGLMTSVKSLRFTQGVDGHRRVRRFAQDGGYQTAVCDRRGAPMPKPQRNGKLFWVPAGSRDDDPHVDIAMDIYVDSKAAWDESPEGKLQYPEDRPPQA